MKTEKIRDMLNALKEEDDAEIISKLRRKYLDLSGVGKRTMKELNKGLNEEHKHKWVWDKNYECSYCKTCGMWDRC